MDSNEVVQSSRRKRLTIVLVIAVVVTQGGYLAWQALRPQPLIPLAAYVLAHGHEQRILPPLAEQLGIPLSPPVCQFMAARSPSGQIRQVQIRQRPGTHYVDIIFSNIAPGETEAYYYLTSQYGKLHKNIYIKTEPQPVENGEERFLKELDFWQTWLREKMKLDEK